MFISTIFVVQMGNENTFVLSLVICLGHLGLYVESEVICQLSWEGCHHRSVMLAMGRWKDRRKRVSKSQWVAMPVFL